VWTATSNQPWLTLTVNTGPGSGSVALTALPNPSATSRTAIATIADQTVAVSQGAADRPLGLTVESIEGNTVTLRWRWPGTVPDRYVLAGGFVPGQTAATLPIASQAPTFTFDAPSGIFYVRVAGVRAGVELPPSDDVRIVVNAPAVPSAPTQLLGLADGSTLTLSWNNTADGGAATGILLDVTGALAVTVPLPVSTGFTFEGVPSGTYTFQVRAGNAQGISAASNAVTLSFPGACQAPAVPEGLEAYLIGNVVTIRWNAPASGPAVTGYVLTVGGAAALALDVPGRSLSSPAPPGVYTLMVAARNACGIGPGTPTLSVTVP
jgi:hypothetical protein